MVLCRHGAEKCEECRDDMWSSLRAFRAWLISDECFDDPRIFRDVQGWALVVEEFDQRFPHLKPED